ncbi:MAG: hypothetical protein HRU15_09230, partial [Planctomycetes bacterium]|nr:hypothetical protein [Planctomycetota bacterium]
MKSSFDNRGASVLLMVLIAMIMLVSLLITFLSLVSRQRGNALLVACRVKAEVAADAALAHVQLEILVDVKDPSREFTRYLDAPWRVNFNAITDPDGDPYTEDGIPTNLTFSDQSTSPIVNVPNGYFLHEMLGVKIETYYDQRSYSFWGLVEGDGEIKKPHLRWYNIEYLNDQLSPIQIDDGLPENAKADLRKSARYIVRYAAHVMDLNAVQGINHNLPDDTVQRGTPNYLRYQNYLRTYGRSIKSQLGMWFKCEETVQSVQRRSTNENFISLDPLDSEPANMRADGSYMPAQLDQKDHPAMANDLRLKVERVFRGDSVSWNFEYEGLNVADNTRMDLDVIGYSSGGKVLTMADQALRIWSGDTWGYFPKQLFTYSPFGDGMLDISLGGSDPVSTPWRVNIMTAAPLTIYRMVAGLSSHVRVGGKDYASVDLFGVGYPEAFPLSLDDGRDVPLVGEISNEKLDEFSKDNNVLKGAHLYGSARRPEKDVVLTSLAPWGDIDEAYQNAYFFDIYDAIDKTFHTVKQVWIDKRPLQTYEELELDGGALVRYRCKRYDLDPSYIIDPNKNDPELMLSLIIQEIYRILGEGYIDG